jgi:hypothetical protein
LFASSRIQNFPSGLDRLEEVWVLDCAGHDKVYGSCKQRFKRFKEAEVSVGVLAFLKRLEFHQQIESLLSASM